METPDARLDLRSAASASGRLRCFQIAGLLLALGLCLLPLDAKLAHPDNLAALPGDLRKFIGLSELFAHGFGVIVISIMIALMIPDARKFIPRIACCAFWPALIANLIKTGFGRFRPIRFFDKFSVSHFPADQSLTWLGWMPFDKWNSAYAMQSFPSAHAATTWGLAIGLSWVFPKGRPLFIGLAILASLQRVMAYAHWPSDVLFGAAIGFCFGGALLQNWGLGLWLTRMEAWLSSRQQSDTAIELDPSDETMALPVGSTAGPPADSRPRRVA